MFDVYTAAELEEVLYLKETKLKAARLILDAAYKAAEDGADEELLRTLRLAASRTLNEDCTPSSRMPSPSFCAPTPWA